MAGRVLDQNALRRFSASSGQGRLWAGICLSTLTICAIDILTPRAFSAVIFLYYFPVLISSRLQFLYAPFVATALVSLAALAGYYIPAENHSSFEFANRQIAIGAFWVMAILAFRRIAKNRTLVEKGTAQQSRERFREILSTSNFGIQIIDRTGRRLFANQALASMLGYESAEAVMALPALGLIAPHDREFAHRRRSQSLAGDGSEIPTYELDGLRKDGTIIHLQIVLQPIDWDGIDAFQQSLIDVSDRQQAQDALADNERRFRELFEDLQLGLMISGQHGKTMVNKALVDLLGYDTADQMLATERLSEIAPHDRHRALTLEKIEQEGKFLPSPFEMDLLHKDGSIVPVEMFWRVFEWEGKKSVQRVFVDLTERKHAEQALIESEQRYRNLVEEAPIGMQIATAMGNRLLVNKALATMLGYESADDLIDLEGRALVAPYHYDRAVPFTDISQPHIPFRETDELDLICKDGSVRTTRVFRRRLIWQGTNAVQLAYIDLTESKRAEKALAMSEERYRDLIEGSTLAMQITDGHLKRLFVNNAMVALLGYESAEELRVVEEFGMVAPEYRNQARAANQFDLEASSTQQPQEIELLRKDGTIVPVQVFRRKILWEGEAAIHRTFIDISERKRAETALVDSEERYRRLFEESPLGIRITDKNGNRMVNQAMATMSGYDSVDEILALPRRALIAPHHRDRALTEKRIVVEGKDVPGSIEIDILKKDGSLLPVQVFWRTLEWGGVKAVERTFIDVSERKEHERALQERDRTVQELRLALANASQIGAMGEVASVIAHELHQPLAAITNTANAAQRRLSDGKEDITVVLNEMLPLISSQATRAGRVIGGIRNLFDGRRVERSREDINLVVAEACELAANEFPSDILEIEQHFADHSPIVQIDRVQIQQVIYNLLRNAVDAMGPSTSKDVIVSIAETDKLMVEISVRDNGPGLPGHVRSKLFEPFFTTKKQGMGMGMGLYTCQRIVEGHDGTIWAESSDDGGTTFRFTLPLAGSAADGTGSVH